VAAGAVRALVARREDGRLRVLGAAAASLQPGAVAGGLVVDRVAVGRGIVSALSQAEGADRAARALLALDGDDIRTYHVATTFERQAIDDEIQPGEVQRATREAREDAARVARAAAAEDPALRGTAIVQLGAETAGFVLDGRPLDSIEGFHGRSVVVYTDVAVAPLLHTGAAAGALETARRRAGTTSGAYALGRLLAESGFTDGGVLRLGADVTAYAVVRDGRVIATRVFGLGRDALRARAAQDDGANVWAQCVLASNEAVEGQYPSRWYFVGVPEELVTLPRALGEALATQRGGDVDIAPLKVSAATRVVTDGRLHPDHLVAVGAAALAAELY
jgi:cell division ATPase FtsA